MATRIAELQVQLSADTGRFRGKMQSAGRDTRRFSSAVGGAKGMLVAMGSVLAAGAIVRGLRSMARSSLEALDAMGKLSDRTGITVSEMMGLQFAAKITGFSASRMAKAIDVLQKRLGEATVGMGTGLQGLKLLNIEIKEIANLDPGSQIKLIADRIAGLASSTQRAAAVSALFSRQNQEMVNMLSLGASGIQKLIDENTKLGNSFSRLDIRRIEQANDSIVRVKTALEGAKNEAVIGLAPAIEALSGKFSDWLSGTKDGLNEVGSGFDSLVTVIGKAGDAMGWLKKMSIAAQVGILATIKAAGEMVPRLAKLAKISRPLGILDEFILRSQGRAKTSTPEMGDALNDQIRDLKGEFDKLNRSSTFSEDLAARMEKVKKAAEAAQANAPAAAAANAAMDAMDKLETRASAIFDKTRTPLEKFKTELADLQQLLKGGLINRQTFGRAVLQLEEGTAAALKKQEQSVSRMAQAQTGKAAYMAFNGIVSQASVRNRLASLGTAGGMATGGGGMGDTASIVALLRTLVQQGDIQMFRGNRSVPILT